jgi:hypothetical protein
MTKLDNLKERFMALIDQAQREPMDGHDCVQYVKRKSEELFYGPPRTRRVAHDAFSETGATAFATPG